MAAFMERSDGCLLVWKGQILALLEGPMVSFFERADGYFHGEDHREPRSSMFWRYGCFYDGKNKREHKKYRHILISCISQQCYHEVPHMCVRSLVISIFLKKRCLPLGTIVWTDSNEVSDLLKCISEEGITVLAGF